MRWIISLLINSLLLIVVSGFLTPSQFYIKNITTAIVASVILSILNVIVKPLLILITLPITILTLGLFLIVINAVTLLITDELMGSAFEISSFGVALLAAVCISILNMLIDKAVIEPLQKRD
ncbi:phage holin family protein [Bacillus sp. 165]|uniref:phage holin family protein n=1 Tax=Bacillus sp. 165 TaxID=1529117 RepID=UPI001ADB6FBF|nr:phage holin family protein [Bacillus sp. 165]MBO9129935.1 phage holin family protein [Bacillus sp. 165]